MSDAWARRGLAAGAGLAMASALPGPGWFPLVLVVPGLLRRSLVGTSGWRAFRIGWLAGFAQWLVAVAWVYIVLHRYCHLAAPLALLAVGVMAAILALGWGLVGWATSLTPERWRPWMLPLALTSFELIQHLPPWIFPWNPAAAVATAWPLLLAPAPIVTAAGVSLLLYLAGGALDALLDPRLRRVGIVQLAAAVAVFAIAALAAPRFRPAGPPVPVAALQPNVPLEVRWDADNLVEIEERVWRLTAEAAGGGARWIIWPESAIPRNVEGDAVYRARIERTARTETIWLLVGSIGRGGADEYFNSVHAATPAGLVPWRYDKVHLVPFGEYLPLAVRGLLPHALVREVGSFTPGRHELPLPSPAGPAGVAVCYEVAYPTLYAAEVQRGATVLANITNDGWYGDSAAPRQHLALAVLRAVESRRYLVRAANTGISAVIDPAGRVIARLDFGRAGLVHADVTAGGGVTPATAHGSAVRLGILGCAAAAILWGARRRARA
jgi:apolipoprotein N-acyltransferase